MPNNQVSPFPLFERNFVLQAFNKMFKQSTGLSPQQYRKR